MASVFSYLDAICKNNNFNAQELQVLMVKLLDWMLERNINHVTISRQHNLHIKIANILSLPTEKIYCINIHHYYRINGVNHLDLFSVTYCGLPKNMRLEISLTENNMLI